MEISGTTRLACLLGYPAKHSKSPAMHNAAFAELNLDYRYLAFDVAPEDLADAIHGLKAVGFAGCNLTMPHKVAIIDYLDEISEVSKLCGAVNTVINRDGRLMGTTTDGVGFFDSLLYENNYDCHGKVMTMLGSGGAACAIAAEGMLTRLDKLFIARRKNEKWDATVDFATRLSAASNKPVEVVDINDNAQLGKAIDASDILVNATNVGMGDDKSSPVAASLLRPDLFVSDIIYHPLETTLLADAKKIGCKTANGLYMLLYQGASSFEHWTGEKMPVDVVKKVMF